MSRKLIALIFVMLSVGWLIVRAQERTADDTIKVATRLVSVPTIVSDRNGRYIPNLTQKDFALLQDGAEQRIEFFAATEEPINVALLIDTSQSTRPVLDDIKDSAKSFLKLLSPADRAMIVAFDYDTHILCPLTGDQERLKTAVKHAEIPDGLFGTVMRDAAYETITRTFSQIKGRKAVILLTDGKDSGSRISPDDLLYRLEESDTLIYTIMFKTNERVALNRPAFGRRGVFGGGFPQPGRRGNDRRRERVEMQNLNAEQFLQKLSELTAGRFYSSKDGKLKITFASIVEELKFQYRLGFYPPEGSGGPVLHNLKIRVSRPDVVVRSRSSYRIEN